MKQETDLKWKLLAIWEEKRDGRSMPSRQDFDVATDLKPFLGYLALLEPVDEARDWGFRVFGTTIATALDQEWQGRRLGELAMELQRHLKAAIGRVVQQRRPVEMILPVRAHRADHLDGLMLPLSKDEARVDIILSLMIPLMRDSPPTALGAS